jgi:hypothetical protein
VDNDPAPPTPAEDPDTPVSTTIERQLRRLPTVLLNAAAVLSTTVMAVAIGPQEPALQGRLSVRAWVRHASEENR